MTIDTRPVFFVHVMKTGGTTLRQRIKASFPESAIYPNATDDAGRSMVYTDINLLRAIPAERRARTRIYCGHFPYIATELLGDDVRTMTVLRDPVERVISHLKQICRNRGGWRRMSKFADVDNPSPEALYEDEFLNFCFFRNHQLRVFGMNRSDNPGSYMEPVAIDAARLDVACRRLEQVDCLGLRESFGDFEREAIASFDLSPEEIPPQHVSTDDFQISDGLRNRIIEDNALDIALYQRAREICQQRLRETTA